MTSYNLLHFSYAPFWHALSSDCVQLVWFSCLLQPSASIAMAQPAKIQVKSPRMSAPREPGDASMNVRRMGFDFDRVFRARPVILAPMEDVSDAVFRRLCRDARRASSASPSSSTSRGCSAAAATRGARSTLAPDDRPTAIQIYGSDPERLAEAARDRRGAPSRRSSTSTAAAGCRRSPAAARAPAGCAIPRRWSRWRSWSSRASRCPVTVKTRIGWGPESHMPIVDLARRLEDAGVARAHDPLPHGADGPQRRGRLELGARARARSCSIPVIVNGDVRTADDAERALARDRLRGRDDRPRARSSTRGSSARRARCSIAAASSPRADARASASRCAASTSLANVADARRASRRALHAPASIRATSSRWRI